jgi:Protein of unknown function (DUF5661)
LLSTKRPVEPPSVQQVDSRGLGLRDNSPAVSRPEKVGISQAHGLHDMATNVTDDDPHVTAKIAPAHLNEFPDYSTRLERMEDEAEREWATRRVPD